MNYFSIEKMRYNKNNQINNYIIINIIIIIR